jgi:UDP-N-acetylmuramoyl-L-alanyl-D-glutamate--2,6-diaminopimelate ligase
MITVTKQSLTSLLAGMLTDPTLLDEIEVSAISLDSRTVQAGGLYLSLATDNKQRLCYLKQAISSGVSVVLYEQEQDLISDEITALAKANIAAYAVRNLADKAGEIAARFYGHPSLALTVIAVTGTNGKTSVSQFIAQSLELLQMPCGVIGTLGAGRIGALNTTGMTTPDPVTLQAILADFCYQGIQYAVIEASSHALQQGRLNSVTIDVAILTNLSRDHLDYHHNMEDYSAAKALLFKFSSVKTAILNSDDKFGQILMTDLSDTGGKTIWDYSQQNEQASFYAKNCEVTPSGIQFEVIGELGNQTIKSSLLGQFNIDNLLATLASLISINISFKKACDVIEKCTSIDGRMQAYGDDKQAQVVVDFAHTPDALTKALTTLRKHLSEKGQLWCVFGCGGDRDVGKRAEMGRSAEQYADKVVLTDDNPRGEDPSAIMNDVLKGISEPKKVTIEHNRKLAIAYAISHASTNDIILVAGKGHEQFQEIAGVKQPYSDTECVKEMLAANDRTNHTMRVGGRL